MKCRSRHRRRCASPWRGGWFKAARACPSPNHGPRPALTRIELVILHSISLPPGHYGGPAVERFFTNRLDARAHPYFQGIADLQVSAHFFVRRDGQVLQFVDVERRAWHAGISQWRGRSQCNDHSVGIELEGLEGRHFEPAQYRSTAALLQALVQRWPIVDLAGHEHVAPGRKADPGPGWDWQRLRRQLRGLKLRWPQDI